MRDQGSGTFQSIAIGVLLSLSLAAPSLAHVSPGYSHDSAVKTRNPDWMGNLKDDVRMSELSMPGTHDTMSFYGGDAVQTQTLRLPDQLVSGIRVLDIRCRHIYPPQTGIFVFAIVHGPVHQNAFFDDVLNAAVDFLKGHPREAVFMRVKEEGRPENIPGSRTFETTFQKSYWENSRWRDYFWKPTVENRNNPTLGEVRGKIVILQDFPSTEVFGVDYKYFDIQDEFRMDTNWDLYGKWTHVLAYLQKANTGSKDTPFMNYLSASRGSFPYFVASGHSNPATGAPRLATGRTTPGWRNSWLDFPRVDCWRVFWTNFCTIAFEGTNILTYERLKNYRRVGVIMSDFPGPGLIDETIKLNDRYKK